MQAGRTTDYGKQQVVAELANVKESEEAAWEGFLKASNRLNNLLDQDKSLVFFPVGYSKQLYENIPLNTQDANAIAVDKPARVEGREDHSEVFGPSGSIQSPSVEAPGYPLQGRVRPQAVGESYSVIRTGGTRSATSSTRTRASKTTP